MSRLGLEVRSLTTEVSMQARAPMSPTVAHLLRRAPSLGPILATEPAVLLGYLHPKWIQDPQKPGLLRLDPQARYGALMAVYDRLRQGKERLGLTEEIRIALPTVRELAMGGM